MEKSEKLFKTANALMPGGVNSPVRAFRAVGGTPKFIARAKGEFIWDADGKRYLDFCGSWGPMILGHSHHKVVSAITKQAKNGMSFGASHENEIILAKLIQEAFPSIEKVRLTSSGTEATMSAIRLARGFTKRKKILKCAGCYHGHGDSLLVKAGSGGATFGIPNSAGVPEELARLTLTIPYNNIAALQKVLKREGKNIAAFILEPVPANIGVLLPNPGYLQSVRQLTKKYGVLLIFDEVITGFRIAFGGAQEYFNPHPSLSHRERVGVRETDPDLTCLGKILGGGLPIGAFGGRAELMNQLAPLGPVYQAGTLSGNPLAVGAGIATLKELKQKGFYEKLSVKCLEFYEQLDDFIERSSAPVTINRIGSLFTIFFTSSGVFDEASAKASNTKKYARFFHALLNQGIYFAPSQFEANFISQAMTRQDLKLAAVKIQKAIGAAL